jgi:hypothetical protein
MHTAARHQQDSPNGATTWRIADRTTESDRKSVTELGQFRGLFLGVQKIDHALLSALNRYQHLAAVEAVFDKTLVRLVE